MDAFLKDIKDKVRERSWRWKLVCCGSRNETLRRFGAAHKGPDDTVVVLLVDSKGPVNALPRAHLTAKDGWNLDSVDNDNVHLMAQTMETWIIADQDTLADYYGQDFQTNALPSRRDLEQIDKSEIASALERSTGQTQKGPYHKIRHAGELLKLIESEKVRRHCGHCERLFDVLGRAVGDT